MSWVPIPKSSKKEEAAFLRESKKKARFLADQNVDVAVAELLRDSGWNAKHAAEAGLLGQPDGYLGNGEVRIPMPEKLKTVDRGLRTVGRSDLVEAFVTSMNRAAEAAVPVARPVFLDAIKSMTIQKRILAGNLAGNSFTGRWDYSAFSWRASGTFKADKTP